jgi:hypothetical protein
MARSRRLRRAARLDRRPAVRRLARAGQDEIRDPLAERRHGLAVLGRRRFDRVLDEGRDQTIGPGRDGRGRSPFGEGADVLSQKAPQHRHALVGGGEGLERVDGDGALGHQHLVVARLTLARLVAALFLGLSDEVDALLADLAAVAEALRIERVAEIAPADHQRLPVVDRHHPAREGGTLEDLAPVGRLPDRAALVAVRQDGLGAARPEIPRPQPGLDVDHAERGLAILDLLVGARRVAELRARDSRVEIDDMNGVLRVLVDLQPVAGHPDREGHGLGAGARGVEDREGGRGLGWPEIGEHEPVMQMHPVGTLAARVADAAGRRFGGGREDRAVDVEGPAVVAARDAALQGDAVFQAGAAMQAMPVQQADPSGQVAEQHQILAQDAQRQRPLAEFRQHRDRLPGPADVFAAGRVGTDRGQFGIGGGNRAPQIAGIRLCLHRCRLR